MSRKRLFTGLLQTACACLFALTPCAGLAEPDSGGAGTLPLSPILITEVQTGSAASGKDEFIELYNAGETAQDIAGWQVRYMSAAAAGASLATPTATITIAASDGGAVNLPAGGYFVLHTAAVALPPGSLGQTYSYTLPASGGSLVLLRADNASCQLTVETAFAWGNGATGEGAPLDNGAKDADMARFVTGTGAYVDTHNNAADFASQPMSAAAVAPTPGSANQITAANATAAATVAAGSLTPGVSLPNTQCTPPVSNGGGQTEGQDGLQTPGSDDTPPATIRDEDGSAATATAGDADAASDTPLVPALPAADQGLVAPQLTELLPNPAPPQTDAADEFIELYNANAAPFDLTGFQLQTGATAKHTFTFAAGTQLPSHGFRAFFSAETGLSLSNSGGQVWLLDPFGNAVSQSSAYGTAKDGQAWALANGQWYWTPTPTPNAANAISGTSAAKGVATAAKTAASAKPKTAAKTSAVKAASTKTKTSAKAKTPSAGTVAALEPPAARSVSARLLALAALFALLYGAYEYRHDLANKFHIIRRDRAARRAHRPRAQGR